MNDQPSGSAPPHFIVLVPGYMGSRLQNRQTGEIIWIDIPSLLRNPYRIPAALENFFDSLKYPNDDLAPAGIMDQVVFVPPLFKQEHYGRLLEKLVSIGYETISDADSPVKPNVYTFAYDWRQDNRISARQLGEAVDGWRARHPGAKAWLIGHSNGGIVSRWYIEKEGGADHVERLFLMGSPWDGAPKSMQVLLSGLNTFMLRLFNSLDIQERTREVILSFPSFYQLIPSHNRFLRDGSGKVFDPFEDTSWLDTDQQRQMLLDGKTFNEELGTRLSVDTLCFFGVKRETTTGGLVHLAPDGKWERIEWDRVELGDGTVPQYSAVHRDALEKLPYVVGHGDIYIHPPVLEKLEWELGGKYRMGVLAELVTEKYSIQFEPVGDVFSPGETIRFWATVAEREGLAPVYGAKIVVSLEWRQGLPPINDTPPGVLPEVHMRASDEIAGRYEGEITAPYEQGYYSLVAKVRLGEEDPVPLEELVLVEAESDLSMTPRMEESSEPSRSWEETGDEEAIYEEAESGDAQPPPFTGPPPPSPPEMETGAGPGDLTQRFLNAEIDDHDMDTPLPAGQEFTLAIYVDEQTGVTAVAFDESRLFMADEDVEYLNVHVSSSDFTVHTRQPQELRVPRKGRSRNTVRFDLEPRAPGAGEVTALIYKENNFVQGINLTLNVETGVRAIEHIESLGRPVDHFADLNPRDVLLFIKNMGERFDLTLVDTTVSEASLEIKLEALNQRILQARQALLDVVYLAQSPTGIYVHPRGERTPSNVNLAYQTGIDIPQEIGDDGLKRLAEAGWLLYQDLFYAPNSRPDANLMGDRLRELAEKSTLKFQVISQEFLLPWGLLYLSEDPPREADPERFLGMRHIIEHIPLQTNMPVVDPTIPSRPHLSVSLNIDSGIDQQMGLNVIAEQIEYWGAIEDGRDAELALRETSQDLLDALNSSETPDQILYFYGHAKSQDLDDPEGPDSSTLGLSEGQSVTLRDLRLFAPVKKTLPKAPLVFINACDSAKLSPLFYGGFMPYFTAKGARGMIGTECEVPARFAAEWARRFFDRFLYQEKPLGELFLELRREFYYQHNNILGLIYALYCDGDTVLSPRLG